MEQGSLISFIHSALGECSHDDVFLVDLHMKGAYPSVRVDVYVDTDKGISVSGCVDLNRCLITALASSDDMKAVVGDDFELTVSSPGIGEPIRHVRQYIRHTGRRVRVQYRNSGHMPAEITGRLIEADVMDTPSPSIVLEPVATGKRKKNVAGEQMRLELSMVSRAVVEVDF